MGQNVLRNVEICPPKYRSGNSIVTVTARRNSAIKKSGSDSVVIVGLVRQNSCSKYSLLRAVFTLREEHGESSV